jgi:hypothetical protein
MFSNLSRGSVLHGIDKSGDKLKWFTGTIERISPSVSSYSPYPATFGQMPTVNLDIVATVDGRQREFKGIHSDDTIADFGKNTVILADSENTLYNHVTTLLKTSEETVKEDNIAWHKSMIPQYRDILSDMRPNANNSIEVKELREQVGSLQLQLAEALALLKGETIKEK